MLKHSKLISCFAAKAPMHANRKLMLTSHSSHAADESLVMLSKRALSSSDTSDAPALKRARLSRRNKKGKGVSYGNDDEEEEVPGKLL